MNDVLMELQQEERATIIPWRKACCDCASEARETSGAALQLLNDDSSESYGALWHPLR